MNYLDFVKGVSFKIAQRMGVIDISDFNEYIVDWHLEEVTAPSGDIDADAVDYIFLNYLIEEFDAESTEDFMREHCTLDI